MSNKITNAPSDKNIQLSDVTTGNVSTTKHGFAPKAPNDSTKFLNGVGGYTVPAGSGGGSGTVTSVTAGDTSIVVGGTATDPTIVTATLDVIATDHAPAAAWSNNSKKITLIADGSSAQDVAAFHQIADAITALSLSSTYQPLDSDLTAIAALTTATYGRSLLTLANEAALYTALGVSTDGTLSGNSDTAIPTQKAVKTYADQLLSSASAMEFKGVTDCSANPNYPSGVVGDTHAVSVAGKIGGASGAVVEAGDMFICITSNAGGTQAAVGVDWVVVQVNINGAVVGPASAVSADFATFSGTSGKIVQDSGLSLSTDGTMASNSDTLIPSQKAVVTALALKAPLASPTLTGTPAAPTAAVDTNTTQIATTAMVLAQAASATPLIDGTATVGTSTRFARGDHIHPTDTSRMAATVTIDSIGGGSDITTNNVTSTKHGLAPKSPADATQFLNGATTPAYAAVKDSDLSTSDITTNNASTTKHGFAPKYPNDATKYLDGTGSYSVPSGGGSIPLTTKGDLYTYSTVGARLAVGTDTYVLVSDSSQTTGLRWNLPGVASLSVVDASIVIGGTATIPTIKTGGLNAIAGATATGGDISMNSHKLTSVTDPTNPQDAATKNYVDTAIAGLDWKAACRLATAAALPTNTYSNGSSGVGATLTGVSFGALSVDGTTVVVGDRILVKNEVTSANNGIYVVTTVGAVATLFVLTRATDYNQTSEIQAGDAVFITAGSTQPDTAWVMTTTGTITVGTTAIAFTQFGAGSNLVSSVFGRTGAVVAATNDYTDAQVQNSPTNKLTTTGDLLYASAANTLARLGIGSGNQVVGISGGVPAWVTQQVTSVATRTGAITLAVADVTGAAPLASPTFTGTPAAPTAAVDTNTTQLATTAMVLAQSASATPLIDGTAAVGTSTRFARGDHVHPTDTTRQALNPRTGTTTSSSTPTINTDNVEYYKLSAQAGDITSFTTNLSGSPGEGRKLWIVVKDNGTARAITWGSKFESGAATLPTTTVVSTRLDVGFVYDSDTSKWRCMAAG